MRVILALALFAVAYADVKVVEEPHYNKPDISPAWVPEDVLAAVKAAQMLRDDLTVHFVDSPLDLPVPEPVKLGEAPQPVVESAQAAVPVLVVDMAEPAMETVRFVDSLPLESAPEVIDPVRVVDMPQPVDAVLIAESPLPVESFDGVIDPVHVVDFAQPSVESVRVVDAPLPVKPVRVEAPKYPGKLFPNPMWR